MNAAIALGDQRAAQLQNMLSLQLEQGAEVSERDRQDAANCLCNPTMLELTITALQEGCCRIKDAVTVIEAHFEQALTADQERRFARELAQMASRTGDVVGRLDDQGGYAIAMPWTEEAQAVQLAQVVQNMAAYAAADLGCVIGHQTLRTTHARPKIQAEPSRQGIGRTTRPAPSASRTVADAVAAVGAPMRRSRNR
jgi:hypothetical protein